MNVHKPAVKLYYHKQVKKDNTRDSPQNLFANDFGTC